MGNEMSRGNEPARPSHGTMGEVTHEGMTIREEFAMAALEGIAAKLPWSHIVDISEGVRGGKTAAKAAIILADALIEALKETP